MWGLNVQLEFAYENKIIESEIQTHSYKSN